MANVRQPPHHHAHHAHHHRPRHPSDVSALEWGGLMIPFIFVLISAFFTTDTAAQQFALVVTLVGIAFILLVVRWRATH